MNNNPSARETLANIWTPQQNHADTVIVLIFFLHILVFRLGLNNYDEGDKYHKYDVFSCIEISLKKKKKLSLQKTKIRKNFTTYIKSKFESFGIVLEADKMLPQKQTYQSVPLAF